ncbi:ubiquitin carboxyl-terminal hydrolase [Coniochaeta sp. 2T2.1]|nr:ubiquitin carboxyl-terminal hydrolase [Coniochaeta sp. 2T2.1]
MPKKFRSIREKNGSHARNKSAEPGHKSRPMSAETFFSIFKNESARQALACRLADNDLRQLTTEQIQDISRRFQQKNQPDVPESHIRYALNSEYAHGDADKAFELLRLQQKAWAGIIEPYNPKVEMVGAENRGNVTCYLDALLFAMYAKLESFECMLKADQPDEKTRKLAALLRLWVNMLRSGRLIHTDMTQHIQEALASCGWPEAELVEQQDTSEAFAFITETLQLPLLTLQVDLFHHGERDNDDHKVVYERLLNIAVPPDPEGKGLKLEDCLEEYFNTKVEVLRDSREEKVPLTPRLDTAYTRLIAEEQGGSTTPVASPIQMENSPLQTPVASAESSQAPPSLSRPVPRHRATSIIQRVVLDDQGRPTESADAAASVVQNAKSRGSTVIKAVTIPAWQFFRLIPWHATMNNEPTSNIEVARHFNQRPVVGICLKRYMMTNQGVPIRQNTFIDIPEYLRLPQFMMVDDMRVEPDALSAEYKLVLQSAVCHRGDSLHSGHYISFARVAPKLMTDNRRHDSDPPPDYEQAQWLKFDDLDVDERVTCIDDIQVALRSEMPYLLFYQIMPIIDVTATSTDGSIVEPPAYDLSAVNSENVPQSPSMDAVDVASDGLSRSTSGYFDTFGPSNGPSVRLSMEDEEGRPVRLSFDDDPYSSTSLLKPGDSRRGSVTFSEPYMGTPAVTPDSHSPHITPADEAPTSRMSRAAARFTKKEKDKDSKSRPTSQAGEGRISLTMSRLGGLMRPSKEPLREDAAEDDEGLVIVGEVVAEDVSGGANGKEKEHRHHHHHHRHRRDRKSKGAGEQQEKDGEERECVVM